MIHIEGIWAFEGADYIFFCILLFIDLTVLYLARNFMSKI